MAVGSLRRKGLIPQGIGRAPDERLPADGEIVWSWRRDPGVKLRSRVATVAKQAAHRGEHEGNRKTIARGKPGDWLNL